MKFQIVDAFTRQTFGGNPAGVVLLPEGAEFPADETMRKTAAELRYSETAFIKPLGGNRFQIRYFTPAAEVELCGHATIGSFHALQEMGLVVEGGTYIDETLSGTLEVVVGKDAILMDMAKPQTFERLETLEEITSSFPGVEKSYAIQAGREVRIMVKPEVVSEDNMILLARDIAKKIESELEYPGQIKVNVIRETKAVEFAK